MIHSVCVFHWGLHRDTLFTYRSFFFWAAEKRVIPGSADGQYEFGSYMSVTMSCDHRAIDGTFLILSRTSVDSLNAQGDKWTFVDQYSVVQVQLVRSSWKRSRATSRTHRQCCCKVRRMQNYSCQVDENNAQKGAVVLHNLGTVSWDLEPKSTEQPTHRVAWFLDRNVFFSFSLLFIPKLRCGVGSDLPWFPVELIFVGFCAAEKLLIVGFAIFAIHMQT